MANIRAFRGVRYNQEKTGAMDNVVTPPYDVISPDERKMYESRSPYNIVRLILPEECDGDTKDKYTCAAETLRAWMENDILLYDEYSCIYACVQEFEVRGEKKRRIGFTCLVHLEDFGERKVLPHENILAKPLEDRLHLILSTKANFDSVFGLYQGGAAQDVLAPFVTGEPDASATEDGVTCSLYRITDRQVIDSITRALANESIVIADGHHRYTAALSYRDEMRTRAGIVEPEAPHEFVMMTLVSMEDPGLVVLPTHRLVSGIDGYDPGAFFAQTGQLFDILEVMPQSLAETVETHADDRSTFGIYTGGKAYVLRLKPEIHPEEEIESSASDALKRLDVSVLHSLILERFLGIGADRLSTQSNISYTRDPENAMKAVDAGQYQLFILMNPTRVEEVRAVAAAGDRMPQKSTFFYPKLLTGMVMRVMD